MTVENQIVFLVMFKLNQLFTLLGVHNFRLFCYFVCMLKVLEINIGAKNPRWSNIDSNSPTKYFTSQNNQNKPVTFFFISIY